MRGGRGCGGNFAAPERSAGAKRRRSVRIGLVKSSDFVQEGQPTRIGLKGCLAASPRGNLFDSYNVAAGLGFEPRLMDPESIVLPLDDPAILHGLRTKLYHIDTVTTNLEMRFSKPVMKFLRCILNRRANKFTKQGVGM